MDPTKFNHDMQTFKNKVKVATEQVSMKLIREIKFWKKKLDSNNERATKKVSSFLSVLNYIKAAKAIDLTKAVLLWKPEEQNGELSVEEKTCQRIYSHKKLSKDIRALVENYNLEKNEAALYRYCNKEKMKSPNVVKVAKVKKEKTLEVDTEEAEETPKKASKEKKKRIRKKDFEKNPNLILELKVKIEEKKPVKKTIKKVIKKKKIVAKIKKVVSSSESDSESEKEKEKFSEEVEDEIEAVPIQDSFFKTQHGSSYVALAPVRDLEKEKEIEQKFNKKRKFKDIEQEEIPDKRFKNNKQHKNEEKTETHPSWPAKQKSFKEFQGTRKQFTVPQVDKKAENKEEIHPSWAAKQKQKGIKDFQGKKIVFGDNDYNNSGVTLEKIKINKPIASVPVVVDPTLHPSWAAKQRQKGIQQFQGKKISFGDD